MGENFIKNIASSIVNRYDVYVNVIITPSYRNYVYVIAFNSSYGPSEGLLSANTFHHHGSVLKK